MKILYRVIRVDIVYGDRPRLENCEVLFDYRRYCVICKVIIGGGIYFKIPTVGYIINIFS